MSVPATSRGRERTRRTYLPAADRRAQILDVAKDVFARRGYHAANVADLCAAAGIGRGTLYQYFDNKHDVLVALMEEIAARVKRVLDERPRVEALPEARRVPASIVAAFCRGRLRDMLSAVFLDEPTLRLVLREARNLDGTIDGVVARIDQMVLAALEADLKAAQRAGVLRRTSPRLTARYLLGGVEKIVLAALAADEAIDLDEVVDVAIEIELFGILSEEVRACAEPRRK